MSTPPPSPPQVDMNRPFRTVLADLPRGSRVAVVTMLGSLCPVTRAHVQTFVEARRLLLDAAARPQQMKPVVAVVGAAALNRDAHVRAKLLPEPFIPLADRARLIGLATADLQWVVHVPSLLGLHDALRKAWP